MFGLPETQRGSKVRKMFRVAKKPGNLEFENLGKQKNLEFFRKIMETWNFF